jgi:hypothetical protein
LSGLPLLLLGRDVPQLFPHPLEQDLPLLDELPLVLIELAHEEQILADPS